VDNSRILVALCEMIKEGGLGDKLSDLPIAGAAPEAMCEKAIAIGFYCVASGAYVNYSPAMRVLGSPVLTKFLTEDIEQLVGGKFNFENDPVKAAQLMMAHMDKKRVALKLRPLMYGKSFLSGSEAAVVADSGAPTPIQSDGRVSGIRKGCSGHAIAVDSIPHGTACSGCEQ
jgi:carbon-monoxide dehydrogenase catalytic subunit